MRLIKYKDRFKFDTHIVRYVREGDAGIWLPESEAKNAIVANGKALILDRLLSNVANFLTYFGVGNSATAVNAATDTQLLGGSVVLQLFDSGGANQFPAPSRSSLTNSYYVTYGTAVANFQHNEIALFNGPTNGTSTMLNRAIVSAYTKTASNSVAYLYQLTQS